MTDQHEYWLLENRLRSFLKLLFLSAVPCYWFVGCRMIMVSIQFFLIAFSAVCVKICFIFHHLNLVERIKTPSGWRVFVFTCRIFWFFSRFGDTMRSFDNWQLNVVPRISARISNFLCFEFDSFSENIMTYLFNIQKQ